MDGFEVDVETEFEESGLDDMYDMGRVGGGEEGPA
jgi:hypothetical protein